METGAPPGWRRCLDKFKTTVPRFIVAGVPDVANAARGATVH